MSKSARDRATSEQMAKTAACLRGYKHSPESRANIRAAKLGDKNPMFGKEVSAATREKKRIASTGRKHTIEAKEKVRAARLGTKASAETRAKMCASHAARAGALWTA
jgi:hypothetical protein